MKMNTRTLTILTLGAALSACGGDDDDKHTGSANLSVMLQTEDAAIEGMDAGSEGATIRDGWSVDFDTYLATVGGVHIGSTTEDGVVKKAAGTYVVDLHNIDANGVELWSLEGVAPGRWNFGFLTPATTDAERHESASEADLTEMKAKGWNYLIKGKIAQTAGKSCPPKKLAKPGTKTANGEKNDNPCYDAPTVSFVLGADAQTHYGPCEVDEVAGVALTDGATASAAITMHVDHLFFNGFGIHDESKVNRYAQWLADCDLNLDGNVTMEELTKIKLAQIAELDDRYSMTNPPIKMETMADYLKAQLKTQGHFQGEGECPIDGKGHDHDGHDDDGHDDDGHGDG